MLGREMAFRFPSYGERTPTEAGETVDAAT
jgi:hypothetical protein